MSGRSVRRSEGTAIHRADARLKILACLAYVLAVVTNPANQRAKLPYCALPLLGVLLLARLPLGKVLARSAAVVPFSLLIALFLPFCTQGHTVVTFHLLWTRLEVTREGLTVLGEVVSKSWLSVLGLVILSNTTRSGELVAGLRRLGLPAVIASTLFLTVRYLILFADEAKQMECARRSRMVKPWYRLPRVHLWGWGIRSTSGMVTSLFIRACDTAERVYLAMASRGFDGEVRQADFPRPSPSAIGASLCFVLIVAAIRVWGLVR
jgi:cobalt/nickel transport system permease protein